VADKKALTRRFIKAIFKTAFEYIGASQITVFVEEGNWASLAAAERLGFTHEGIMRKASYNKKDLHVFGMLKKECPWI
jgi:RimJ/RimL family protein N-acetyltransferase